MPTGKPPTGISAYDADLLTYGVPLARASLFVAWTEAADIDRALTAYLALDQKLLLPDPPDNVPDADVVAARALAERLADLTKTAIGQVLPILRSGKLTAFGRLQQAGNEWRLIHREGWRDYSASILEWLKGHVQVEGLVYRGVRLRPVAPLPVDRAALAYCSAKCLSKIMLSPGSEL